MTASVRSLIASFDKLSALEQREAAAAILSRTTAWDSPSLTEEDMLVAADTLFLKLDAEEGANETPQPR